MKKLLFVITIVIACFSFCIVKADTISFSGDTEFSGNSFSINVNVNATNKLEAAVFPITYDKNKITIDSNLSAGQNGFTMNIDKNIVFDDNGKTGNFTIGKIVFNATDNFKVGESTTITLGNGKFSDDTNETSVKGTSITVKRIASSSGGNTQTCTDAPMNFKLTYVTNGGNTILAETITANTTGVLPIPEKENNTFKGWYYDSALTQPVAEKSTKADLAKPITENNCITGYSDVTIYAKWQKKLASDDNTDNNDDLSGNTGTNNKDDSSNNTNTDNKDNSSNNNTDNKDDSSNNTNTDNKDDSSSNTNTDNKDDSSNNTNTDNKDDSSNDEKIEQVDTGSKMPLLITPLSILGILFMKKLKEKKKIYKL